MKFDALVDSFKIVKSLPVRGAWIEIIVEQIAREDFSVAPRTGSVD